MKKIFACILIIISGTLGAQNIKKGVNQIVEGMALKNQQEQADLLAKSIEIFDKAVLKDTSNASAYLGLAIIYSIDEYLLKDYFKAWNNFKKAKLFSSNISEEDAELFNIYFSAQDIKRRNKDLQKNLEIEESLIEDKLIKYVREENNIEIAKLFIKEYSDSRYFDNVAHIRNYLEFRIAEKENTISGFQNFIMEYPEAAQIDMAVTYIEKLAFLSAKENNSIDDLNAFINNYPDSKFNFEATMIRNELAYKKTQQVNTIAAFDEFMSNYPNAMQFSEAKKKKMQLVFEKAKSVNTIEAYNEFVEMYPDGEHFIDIFNLKANALGQKIMENNNYTAFQPQWIKSFDNIGLNDEGFALLMDSEKEILVLGTTENKNNRSDDIWFLKLNENGKMLWNRQMGDTLNERLVTIDKMNENQFIAAGMNKFNDSINGKAWIVGADFDGGNAWNKNVEARKIRAIKSYSSNDFIIGGSYFYNDSIEKMYLSKVRKDGKTSWQRYYSMETEINSLGVTDSSDIILAGSNYIFSVNTDGYINWEKQLEDSTFISNCEVVTNSIYFIENRKEGTNYITKMDTDGNQLWSNQLSFKDPTNINDIVIMPNDEIVLSGIQNNDVIIQYLGANGEIIKESYFGTPADEINSTLFNNGNQLYILITIEYRLNDRDILVIKL